MARFKVPQNLEMEDRIIGNLAMWQFVYLVVGGILAYAAYMKLPSPLNIIVALPIGLFAAASGLIKVNNQPFPRFFGAFVRFLTTPRERVWRKENIEEVSSIKKDVAKKETKKTVKKTLTKEELQRLAQVTDSHGFSEIDQS
jgi:hypothetical protein